MPETSEVNGRKLDEILQLIKGDGPEAPGMLARVARHDLTLYGADDKPGIVTKVNTMWRIHVWLLCSFSGLGGFLLKAIVDALRHP